ncbi:hypothetical protein PESP_a2197 [Pseudoalteromonas espejiana DSM 9414]|nr:hypothetical protein [Pseudoalteromonas espejiana]ASM50199.1 hypothetical protein PESP_a2197 [Pseudoalteromonas espejiana DSM 9414]
MKNKTIKPLLLICAFSASLIFSAFVRAEQASELEHQKLSLATASGI